MNKNKLFYGLAILAGLTSLFFNNCSGKFLSDGVTAEGVVGASSLAAESAFAEAAVAAPACATEEYKVLVSSSLTGPWVENGNFCRGRASYFKLASSKPGVAIKGCTAPSPGAGCLDLTKHREFLPSEWINGNVITTVTAAESLNYPKTEYTFFVSLPGAKRIVLEKVGTASLVDCPGSPAPPPPPPAPLVCSWQIINPQPVVGGGSNVYPATTCNLANRGLTGSGYYDMGSGNHLAQSYECKCQ